MLSVIIFIIIIISIFFIYNNNTKSEKIENLNITDNIDNLEIMERSPAYQNLIKKLLSNKKEIFTEEEMDIMKNKFQFYDTEDGIKNITSNVLKETKNLENILLSRFHEYYCMVYDKIYSLGFSKNESAN